MTDRNRGNEAQAQHHRGDKEPKALWFASPVQEAGDLDRLAGRLEGNIRSANDRRRPSSFQTSHRAVVAPPIGGSKETYLIIGRRGGKSFISALVTCFIACFIDFKPFITVGETLVVMCLARDKEQARIVFRYVKAILNYIPALRGMIVEIGRAHV